MHWREFIYSVPMQYPKKGRAGSLTLGKAFDSPVIYGARVETSNPYHLVYIENSQIFTLAYLDYQ